MNRYSGEKNVPLIDLSAIDDVIDESDEAEEKESLTKYTFRKTCTNIRMKKNQFLPLPEQIYESCFPSRCVRRYLKIINNQKETYVGESLNPFLGDALFAVTKIKIGQMISVYFGRRMPDQERKARGKAKRNTNYMISIGSGISIDGYGIKHGACMANHSCDPNSKLVTEYICKKPRVPIALLVAIKDINEGSEIECDYGWIKRGKNIMKRNGKRYHANASRKNVLEYWHLKILKKKLAYYVLNC